MAQANSKSTRKAFHVLGLFSLLLLIQKGSAFEFRVGGFNGWTLPPDPYTKSLNQWAENNRFQIGDTLLFVYSANKDSLLYVIEADYLSCNTSNPVKQFTDGRTVFNLDHSGPYYFISGVRDNCLKNEKLHVVVLADRSKKASSPPPPSPSAEAPPSPAPAGESPPSPPPPGAVEINPTPAPSQQSKHHKNGASSLLMNFIAPLGAFVVGSSLLMVF